MKRTSTRVVAVLVGLVAVLGQFGRGRAEDLPAFRVDHFKFYRATTEMTQPTPVILKGQFDKEAVRANVGRLMFFANPVSKNGEKILDPNAHLSGSALMRPEPEPNRVVVVRNQFLKGEPQELRIGPPALLLVPTAKRHADQEYPLSERLDHYKCYRVQEAKSVEHKVTLVDQFDKEENLAGRPVLFCVPVSKRHADKESKVLNERDHLTVYLLERHKHDLKIEVKNQIGRHKVAIGECVWLAVPSVKEKWEPVKN